jgi:hypothetical protein
MQTLTTFWKIVIGIFAGIVIVAGGLSLFIWLIMNRVI